MLEVLGRRTGDDRILDAIVLVGPRMEVADYDLDGWTTDTWVFEKGG